MPEDSIKSLRTDLEATKSEAKVLREKVEKAETWLKALAIVASVFGIAGAFGWNALSSAREQLITLDGDVKKAKGSIESAKQELTEFTAARKRELAAEAEAAVAAAARVSNPAQRLAQIESRLSVIRTAEAPVSSGQPIGQIRTNMAAGCPSGQVAKAIKLNLGGTCNSQCNGDGQPVSQLEVTCVDSASPHRMSPHQSCQASDQRVYWD